MKQNLFTEMGAKLFAPLLTASVSVALATVLGGCRVGGGVTTTPTTQAPTAFITAPIITLPASTPYYSKDGSMTMSGICNPGSMVYLTGAANDEQVCANGVFSFTTLKANDGIFTYLVTQANSAQYYSNPAVMVWVRKSSVAPVILTAPTTNPFYSGASTLAISGVCETGASITLTGGGAGSATCANSAFTIHLPKAADGNYLINVNQTDGAGNVATVSFEWRRITLTVTPNNTSIEVADPQQLVIGGGSGTYTLTVLQNDSGGTLDTANLIWTPGPLANKTDKILVVDSLQNNTTVTLTTHAGAPDHFTLASSGGADQQAYIGTPFAAPIRVKVVDFHGNGIGAIPVYFQPMLGDAVVTSNALTITDATGVAEATVKAGYSAVINGILASSIGGDLPDRGASGKGSLLVPLETQTKNTGAFGSTYPVGSNPGATIAADFNGDGFVDIAILNIFAGKVGILQGAAGGLFKPMVNISVCSGPAGITAGKFVNANNRTDLLVVCSGSNRYQLLVNNGDGTFTAMPAVAVQASQPVPTAVVSGDFNGDGVRDFAITSAGAGKLGIYFGNGTGGFTPSSEEYDLGQTPTAIKTLDLNKTGRVDLVVANAGSNNIGIFENKGNGRFFNQRTVYVGANPVALAVGDVAEDGYDDVLVLLESGTVVVGKNDKTGGFETTVSIGVGTSPSSIALADFDKDTHLDVVVTNMGDSSVTVLHGQGNGTFLPDPAVPTVDSPVYVTVVDVDKDTQPDLVITGSANAVLQVLLGHPGGQAFGLVTTVGSTPSGAVFTDFDGDGIPDAIVANSGSNNVSLLKGKGNGFFDLLGTKSTGAGPSAIVKGDFNGDGKMDFAVTNQTGGTVSVFLADNAGGFANGVIYLVGSSPKGLATADVNRDGLLDLVSVNSGPGTISVLINDPLHPGTFKPKVDFPAGSAPVGIAIGDFNGDHKLDVATTSSGTDSVYVLLGNGDGTFRSAVMNFVGTSMGPTAIVAVDLNGDSLADLVTANSTDHSISVLIAQSDGTFRANPASYEAGPTPISLVLGDFNHDGRIDVAVANGAGNSFTIVRGNGNGTFNSAPSTFMINSYIGGMIAGDFNKDSNLDLMLFDTFVNRILLWQGQ